MGHHEPRPLDFNSMVGIAVRTIVFQAAIKNMNQYDAMVANVTKMALIHTKLDP